MISLIITTDPVMRDLLANELSLKKDDHNTDLGAMYYRRGAFILVFLPEVTLVGIQELQALFEPERVFFPFFGTSISDQHFEGDIIFPNIFFSYDPKIRDVEFDRDNRDQYLTNPTFLTHFDLHEDYLVTDHGVSVGWIMVSQVSSDIDDELATKIHYCYESDILVPETIDPILELAVSDSDIVIIAAVIHGQKSKEKWLQSVESWCAHHLALAFREIMG